MDQYLTEILCTRMEETSITVIIFSKLWIYSIKIYHQSTFFFKMKRTVLKIMNTNLSEVIK